MTNQYNNTVEQTPINMDEQEATDFSSENESRIFKKRTTPAVPSRQNQAKQKRPTFLIIASTVLITVFLIMGLRLYDLQKAVSSIQLAKKTTSQSMDTSLVSSTQVRKEDIVKINQLEMKVKRLTSVLATLQSENSGQKLTSFILANLTSSQLSQYIEMQFGKHKVMINFLQMHNREVFYYDKVDFLKSVLGCDMLRTNERAKIAFMQALANFKLPHFNIHMNKQIKEWQEKDKNRISRDYDLSMNELPFCIVVPTVNNANKFRYEYNLQSIINLDYTNYKVVIIDDASTDHTSELIRQWIKEYQITQNIVVITNQKRRTAVPNIHVAVTQHCGPNDIIVLVDGDDELLGRYSLKVFNQLYQKNKADIVYSNHLQFYTHIKQVYPGWSMDYSEDEKKNNRYRDVPQKISHLRSFKGSLYRKIKEEDLKDDKGEWLTSTYDQVICLPMFQMSCGRITYIPQFFYLYNFGIGTNDLQVDPGLQKNIADYVKFKKPKYQCLPQQ